MSRSSRHKEKHGLRSVISQENRNEGTAARTRPFSFDEIMFRRKNKKLSGDVKAVTGEAESISVKDIEKVSDHSVSSRGYKNSNNILPVIKHASEDFLKVRSRKKEDNTTASGDRLVNQRDRDRDNRDSGTKSKATLNRDVNEETKGSKDDRLRQGRRKEDEWGNESEKRHARNLVGKDRYADSSRGRSEKENERKHRNGDDERIRERNPVKKYDSRKWDDLETSKRKERKESSEFRKEESRPKKRRSRSRERDKDRGRRSDSLSPRAHKRTSFNLQEQGELSSHSSKDRSRRQQHDDERNKISSNGSNSHYRRHDESESQLGGYSPRKRKTEAAVKTPSPSHWSHPEKKSAAWDLPPAGADSNLTVSVISNTSLSQTVAVNRSQISSVDSASSKSVKALSGIFSSAVVDSIQLTQATRPMRRLYVENLPASASDKDVMEYLNKFLLPSGLNHIQGPEPCISCIIHKEKGQALVEFLTPEYASAALSFDGRSFSGSILKIRRPKDYVEVATGVPDKSVAAVDSTSDIVRDSPHKIFIGGISKAISPEMLVEIVSAFGTLKAYHFEVNVDLKAPCAFLEYVDQSVTLKACAGLNGMMLGGQMLTVVLATPDASSFENTWNPPFYGIPEHTKPLLEKPTQVLKLKNVLDPEGFLSLSDLELEGILEDTRLECARFGTINSVNFIKCGDCDTNEETCKVPDNPSSGSDMQDLDCENKETKTETSGEHIDCDSLETSRSEPPNNSKEEEVDKAVEGEGCEAINGEKLTDDLMEDEMCKPSQNDSNVALQEPTSEDNYNAISLELPDGLKSEDQMVCCNDKVDDTIRTTDTEMEQEVADNEKLESNGQLQEALAEMNFSERMDSDAHEKGEDGERDFGADDAFEPGCVLVEYKRTEAASMAARCLHGRLFDNRIVTVGYVDYNTYKARFPK